MKPLFVDGTNLLIAQEKLFGPSQYLSFSSLMKFLGTKLGIDYCYFYASFNPEPPRDNILRVEQYQRELKFFNDVKSVSNLEFIKGHRSPTSGKEKGVDVKLAVDLATKALEEQFTEACVMTGDADFDYAVEKATSYGTGICVITLPNIIPLGISRRVPKTYILDFGNYYSSNIEPLIKNKPKSLEIINATPEVDLLEAK